MNIEEALKIADDGGQQAFVTTRGMACVALAAEVRRLRNQWQPIETAPNDGSPVIVLADGGCTQFTHYTDIWICRFDGARWIEAGGELYSTCTPTHWMPLPLPPENSDE